MQRTLSFRSLALAVALATATALLALASPALANHPVFVEGNCLGPGSGGAATGLRTSPVPAGTCGDYDGDGNIGMAEDNDGDNNFGTIGAAVAAVANNGRVTIVANGIFPETVNLAPTNSANVTLEAAPGIDANIDAVVQGDPGSGARQGQPGIVVNGDDSSRVTVRNIMTRNWTVGVLVQGDSHVALDDIRAESNVNYNIQVLDNARAAISDSEINAAGIRRGAGGPSAPNPGIGIEFDGDSRGSIYNTTVSGSFAAGISANSRDQVELRDVQAFDNNPNFMFGNDRNDDGFDDDDRDDDRDDRDRRNGRR